MLGSALNVERWLGALLLVLAVVWGWPARVSANPQIPRVSDGEGVAFGKHSKFHGGVALPVGMDSNVFNQDRAEDPTVAAYIYPSAWLGIGNRPLLDGTMQSPPERTERIVDYNISVLAGFRQFLARDIVVRSQPKFSIGAQPRITLFPGRRATLALEEDFYRGADPGNYRVDGRLFNFSRIDHNGRLTFIGRPGGGRLSLLLGYQSQVLRFASEEVNRANRMVNGLIHETSWRFFPKSAVVFRYDFAHTFYLDCCTDPGTGRNEDNFAHRITGGYRGQLAKKIVLQVMAGWGLGFYRNDPNGPNFSSFIGDASFNYFPTLRSRIHVSVYRRFSDSLWGNYFVDNGGRISLSHTFRWRMIAHLGGDVAGRVYHGLPVPGEEDDTVVSYQGRGADQFRQYSTLVSLDAGIEQPLRRIFSLQLTYRMLLNATDFQVSYQNGSNNRLRFAKHLLWFMAAVRI